MASELQEIRGSAMATSSWLSCQETAKMKGEMWRRIENIVVDRGTRAVVSSEKKKSVQVTMCLTVCGCIEPTATNTCKRVDTDGEIKIEPESLFHIKNDAQRVRKEGKVEYTHNKNTDFVERGKERAR